MSLAVTWGNLLYSSWGRELNQNLKTSSPSTLFLASSVKEYMRKGFIQKLKNIFYIDSALFISIFSQILCEKMD
jgi:hypothetical protein